MTFTKTIFLSVVAQILFIIVAWWVLPVVNISSFIRFIVTLECFLVFFLFLFVRQFIEAFGPKDFLTGFRYMILGVLGLTVLTLIPSIVYQFFRAIGQDYELLRNFVTTISGINLIGFTLLFVLMFTYKIKR